MKILRDRRSLLLVVLGLLVFLVGLFLFLQTHKKTLGAPPTIISPNPFPSQGPENIVGMRVKEVELSINLPVVEGDGWTVPLYKAAHYPGMKLPGEGGRSLLYAHAQKGMFGPLLHPGAKIGDHVEVDRQDKPVLYYLVAQVFPRWPPNDLKWVKPGDHEELVLLTCTSYNANDPRVIVVAEPAGSGH